jgi:predicted methyltransferase
MTSSVFTGMRKLGVAAVVGAVLAAAGCATSGSTTSGTKVATSAIAPGLQAVIAGEHRSAANKARDPYRHPAETLSFFGITPKSTVVELWPFGGWYAEILAPYVRTGGVYYAAAMDPASTNAQDLRYNESLNKLLAARPDLYSKVRMSVLAKGKADIAPAGTADLVVSFRNIHNWVWSGLEKEVFEAAFRALKPGGVLGIVEHRNVDPNYEPKTPGQAYVGEDYAVKLIESAGFKLAARSNINNNPKDTKDYARGVWTLPPNYALGDQDRAKYTAIGESDRFTLKFVKPKN